MTRILASLAAVTLLGSAAFAEDAKVYDFDGSFDDAAFEVQTAIEARGLVIDSVSHVGEMLSRTGADVGSDVELFGEADIFVFCSAVVSRKVMEVDPMNIAHCPYGIFVAEQGDAVLVGYRTYPDGSMQEVQALLDDIAREATGN